MASSSVASDENDLGGDSPSDASGNENVRHEEATSQQDVAMKKRIEEQSNEGSIMELNAPTDNSNVSEKENVEELVYKCQQCGLTAHNQDDLAIHIFQHHFTQQQIDIALMSSRSCVPTSSGWSSNIACSHLNHSVINQ